MGAGFAVILLGIIILLLVPFIYFGIRMAGFPKAAVFISVAVFLIVSIPLLKISYRSQMYSKEDALVDFQEARLNIKGALKVHENDISGFKLVEQKATFILDSTEVNEIIHKMESHPNFIISPTLLDLRDEMERQPSGKIIRQFRHKDLFVVETYQTLDEYTVKSSTFTFKKNNDTVQFHKIEDY